VPCFASVVYFALLTLGLTACSAPLSGPRRPTPRSTLVRAR